MRSTVVWLNSPLRFFSLCAVTWWSTSHRVLQLLQHGLNEALQQRHQSVGRAQASTWRHVDEGRPPLTVIQRAVVRKLTQVPKEGGQSVWSHIPERPNMSKETDVCCTCQRLLSKPHPSLLVWTLWRRPSCWWASPVSLVLPPHSSDSQDRSRTRLCLCSRCSSLFAPERWHWSLWLRQGVQQTGTHEHRGQSELSTFSYHNPMHFSLYIPTRRAADIEDIEIMFFVSVIFIGS